MKEFRLVVRQESVTYRELVVKAPTLAAASRKALASRLDDGDRIRNSVYQPPESLNKYLVDHEELDTWKDKSEGVCAYCGAVCSHNGSDFDEVSKFDLLEHEPGCKWVSTKGQPNE
jgi:hypothetical protein